MPVASTVAPFIIFLAAVILVQVSAFVALIAPSPSIRKAGAFLAAALAGTGILITLTLAVSLLLIIAAFVIDSAAGHPPADLDQILVELHLAQYVSATGLAVAVPLVGAPSLLNARAALTAFAQLQRGRVSREELPQAGP